MSHVFISYSRKDGEPHVSRLDTALQDAGFSTWRDLRNINPHQDFSAEIEKAIETASHVLVVLTPDSKRANSFVRREIQYALAIHERRQRENGGSLPVIPLRFADIEPHISIINNEWVDCFKGWATAFERICTILRGAPYQNAAGDVADPFRPYLQKFLERVVEYFKQALITKQQIDLYTEESPDAVNAPMREHQPDMMDQVFAALAWYVPTEEAPPAALPQFKTFNAAFAHFEGRMLLLGESGAGKTITLMAHAREAVAARLDDPTQPLPLLGVIATWDAQKQTPLAEWLTPRDLTTAQIEREITEGRALLLLDGLDELGGERPVDPQKPDGEKYDPRAQFVAQIPANNQILITCRVQDYADLTRKSGEKLALNGAVTLQALTDEQLQLYLQDQPKLWDALQADDTLKEVARTPLLLSLFAFTYNELTPQARADLLRLKDAGEVRDKLWLNYIRLRYAHEERRLKRQNPLPFTLDEVLANLGELAMVNASGRRDWLRWGDEDKFTTENVLLNIDLVQVAGDAAEAFIELCLRLHFLTAAEGKEDGTAAYRFMHLRLRDALAFTHSRDALGDADGLVRRFAADALGEFGDARAVDPLIAALHDKDVYVRRSAADALGEFGDARAVAPLIAALRDQEWFVRLSAAEALGRIGDARAVAPLIAALKDERREVRSRAAEALGRIGDARAVAPLIAALRDEHSSVRLSAADALGEIGDARAVEPLIAALRDADSSVRLSAAGALGKIGDARAVEPLIAALRDADVFVRSSAAAALGKIGTPAVDSLIAALRDADDDVRRRAADALVIIGVPAVAPLIIALRDADWRVRLSAADALGKIGDARAVEPLIAALRDADVYVRSRAAYALGRIGDARAVAPLIAALRDADGRVRRPAADALGKLGDARAVELLIAALRDEDEDVRRSAAAALGRIGDARAVEPLIAALQDTAKDSFGRRVCDFAAKALERIGTPEALAAVEAWREFEAYWRRRWGR